MNSARFRIAAAVLLCGAFALTQANPAAAFIRLGRQFDASSPVVQAYWLDAELPRQVHDGPPHVGQRIGRTDRSLRNPVAQDRIDWVAGF